MILEWTIKNLTKIKKKISKDLDTEINNHYKKFKSTTTKKANKAYEKALDKKTAGDPGFIEKLFGKKNKGYTPEQRFKKLGKREVKKRHAIVDKGIKKGESYADIAKKLQERLKITESQALRIARTEGHRIVETSTYQGYEDLKKSGIRFTIYWTATKDGRTREEHSRLDGKAQGKDGYFRIGKYRAKYPGDFGYSEMDINCRCSTYIRYDTMEIEQSDSTEGDTL